MQVNKLSFERDSSSLFYTPEANLKPLDHLIQIEAVFKQRSCNSSTTSLIVITYKIYLYGSYPNHEVEKVKEVFLRILKLAQCPLPNALTDRFHYEMGLKPLNISALERLVDLGAETSGHHLVEACENGLTDCVPVLLRGGADINYRTCQEDGRTPLFIASGCGRHQIVELLLKAGADTQLRTFNKTPFEWAVTRRHNDVVRTYINLSKVKQSELSEVLPSFIENSEEIDWTVNVLRTLIENGADTEQKTEAGITIPGLAINLGKNRFAKELTKQKLE